MNEIFNNAKNKIRNIVFPSNLKIKKEKLWNKIKNHVNSKAYLVLSFISAIISCRCAYISDTLYNNGESYEFMLLLGIFFLISYGILFVMYLKNRESQSVRIDDIKKRRMTLEEINQLNFAIDIIKKDLTEEELKCLLKDVNYITGKNTNDAYFYYYIFDNYEDLKNISIQRSKTLKEDDILKQFNCVTNAKNGKKIKCKQEVF